MSNLTKLISVMIIVVVVMFGKSMKTVPELYQQEIQVPAQKNIVSSKAISHSGEKGEVRLLPKARYEIKGVVKSKKKYSDFTSQISKYDLAMAWGNLNKDEIDSSIKYSQRGRWYFYSYKLDSSVNQDYISKNSANVHIIHKNKDVLKQIKNIDKGDMIELKGFLVDVDFKNSNNQALWSTSMTRDDTGDGSCEILYVEEISVIN